MSFINVLAIFSELARYRSAISTDWGGCSCGYSVRLSNVVSVCSLIRVCRKLSPIVFDDVLGLIRDARVGVSLKCMTGLREKKMQKLLLSMSRKYF